MSVSCNQLLAAFLSLCVVGYGGSKMLKEPLPVQLKETLASVTDNGIEVSLDWVIVRNGTGSWAGNADWDEYLISVTNRGLTPIRITEVIIVDSLGEPVPPEMNRKALVKASKKSLKRYKKQGIKVIAGIGMGTMIASGVAISVLGGGLAIAGAEAMLLSAGMGGAAGGAGILGGLVLLGPFIVAGVVVRGVRHSAVNKHIEVRQTLLPHDVVVKSSAQLDVFFPITPGPVRVQITYESEAGEQIVSLETKAILQELHLKRYELEETKPAKHCRHGQRCR
ncbi:MAG TPA: hypothetical protein DCM54_10930 [Gammaproteobacteria bacterium]|nr:hypothetical protein [Gammaproteobacteria bacterium]